MTTETKTISARLSVAPQTTAADVAALKSQGFRAIICNRPDDEGAEQPSFGKVEQAAKSAGLEARYIPITHGIVSDEDAAAIGDAAHDAAHVIARALGCRQNVRHRQRLRLRQRPQRGRARAGAATGQHRAGQFRQRSAKGGKTPTDAPDASHDVVIVGAGAAGIAVAKNVIADIGGKSGVAQYNGYGSCPLAVERGKIVLAEFGYGGRLLPSMPKALIDGTKPSRAAWFLKQRMLPPIYWKAMLRGREWLATPEHPGQS